MDKIKQLDEKIEQIRFYKLIGKTVYIAIFCLLIALVLWICSNSMMMQKDTLNTLNAQQQEINDLSVRITNVELLYQTEQKSDTAGTQNPISLSQGDRELIERVCMAEAGNDLEGNMAVATVIHDRATLWNMQPIEVVTADSQFAKPRQGELYEESVQAVWAVFDEGMRATEENITHFHAEGTSPYWAEDKQFVCSRGGNRFYR